MKLLQIKAEKMEHNLHHDTKKYVCRLTNAFTI